jgi:hydroxymethylglutaryl-CoA reductase
LLWRQNHLLSGWERRRLAVVIHSLTSGLFLPFLVVYVVQAGHLSLVCAGVALLWGLATAKLGPVGVHAMRQGARSRSPAAAQ